MHVSMIVCVYACMYVRPYVCMYVCTHMFSRHVCVYRQINPSVHLHTQHNHLSLLVLACHRPRRRRLPTPRQTPHNRGVVIRRGNRVLAC